VHVRSGNTEAARTALEKALRVQQQPGVKLDAAAALEVAQACFAGGRPEEAKSIIQTVAEDNHENGGVLAKAQSVFAAAGLEDEGTIFIEATRKRMIKLNNDAVALVKAGQLDQAIAMLTEAADRLTNNAQISLNAALALLMQVHRNGMNSARMQQAQAYITQAQQANPEHPKLAEANNLYRKLALGGVSPGKA
jgi:tetratricopeptide (TPR) repeat protein